MSTPTPIPYDWIREIPTALKLLDDIPLVGYPPEFPFKDYSAKLGKILQIDDLSIQLGSPEWRTADQLMTGLSDDLIAINLTISPVEGTVSFVFPRFDIATLLAGMISSSPPAVLDKEYLEGFFQFVALEAIATLQGVEFDKNLSPQLLSSKELPNEASLCRDLTLTTHGKAIHGRLIISQKFRSKWKERYSQRSLTVPPKVTQQAEVTVHIEAGHTSLGLNEWRGVSPGDFIILDQCSLSLEDDKSRVMLTLNGKPTFRARLKQGTLKILEYPMFYEVETPMAKYNPDEDHDEDSELEGEDEEFQDSEIESDLDIDDDEEFDDEVEEEVEAGAAPTGKPSLKPNKEAVQVTRSTESHAAPSPDEIPVNLVVEVGRFQITVQKLMELQPGNLLELDVKPENGVDLVINGKCVGKGELLRIGETLGVRILDMAN